MLAHPLAAVEHRLSCFDRVGREDDVALLRHSLRSLLVLGALRVTLHVLRLVWMVR